MIYTRSVLQMGKAAVLCAPLMLAACGGDSGESNNGQGDVSPSLQGSLLASSSTTSVRAAQTSTSAMANAVVLAVDENGNSFSTATNKVGDFEFTQLKSGQAYAVVVVDSKSNNVLASLVSSDPDTAGAVVVEGHTDLGDIIINSANQTAIANVSSGIVLRASPLDLNQDGRVSADEISNTQAATIKQQGVNALSNISLVNYLGDENTWSLYLDEQGIMDENGNSSIVFASKTMRLISSDVVEGPNGDVVAVARESSLNYYKFQDIPFPTLTPGVTDPRFAPVDSGYIGQKSLDDAIAACNDPSGIGYYYLYTDPDALANPPAEFDACVGLETFAEYRYVDTANDRVIYGMKMLLPDNTFGVFWGGMSLPLNFEPGVPQTIVSYPGEPIPVDGGTGSVSSQVSIPENLPGVVSDSYQVVANPPGNDTPPPDLPPPDALPIPIPEPITETITVDFVKDAIVTDTLGNELPVIRVQFDTVIGGQSAYSYAIYVVAKYGVRLSELDVKNQPRSWDVAFAQSARFGVVEAGADNSVSFSQTNPQMIGAQAAPGAMLTQGAGFDAAKRDSWLQFVAANHEQFDAYYFPPDPCMLNPEAPECMPFPPPCDSVAGNCVPPEPCVIDPNAPGTTPCLPPSCDPATGNCVPPEPCAIVDPNAPDVCIPLPPCVEPIDPNAPPIDCLPPPPPPCDPLTDANCIPPEPCLPDGSVPGGTGTNDRPCIPPLPPIVMDFGLWLECAISGCVTPAAWDISTNMPIPLIAGTQDVAFETGTVNYLAKVNVSFHVELRSIDATGMFSVLPGAATAPVAASATTGTEGQIAVAGTMNIPALSDFAVPGWLDKDGKAVNEAHLWLVMTLAEDWTETMPDTNGGNQTITTSAGTVVFEQPLERYMVKEP